MIKSNFWQNTLHNSFFNKKNLRVLASWEIDPSYMPPFQFSSNQINVCRSQKEHLNLFTTTSQAIHCWSPDGEYDLYQLLMDKGIDTNFDLIVVWSSSAKSGKGFYNRPTNLHKFSGRKLLILGDTHHMDRPISAMIDYANIEQFSHITTMYDRHHLHYFEHVINSPKLGWFPMASLQHRRTETPLSKSPTVSLLGNIGSAHAYRQKIISKIQSSEIDLIAGVRKNEHAFKIYQNCLVNINVSLNGDLNLRTHEITMAGGFLLTDQLSPESGFENLLEVGRHCDVYSNPEDLLTKIDYYLARPKLVNQIAHEGLIHYLNNLHPRVTLGKIMEWVFEEKLDSYHDLSSDWRHLCERDRIFDITLTDRIATYERIQELGRISTPAHIFIGDQLNPAHLLDLVDLIRVNIYIDPEDYEKINFLKRYGLENRVTLSSKDSKRWNLIL